MVRVSDVIHSDKVCRINPPLECSVWFHELPMHIDAPPLECCVHSDELPVSMLCSGPSPAGCSECACIVPGWWWS
jgi:hypothetical protein